MRLRLRRCQRRRGHLQQIERFAGAVEEMVTEADSMLVSSESEMEGGVDEAGPSPSENA